MKMSPPEQWYIDQQNSTKSPDGAPVEDKVYALAFDPKGETWMLNPGFQDTSDANVKTQNILASVPSAPPQIDPLIKQNQNRQKLVLVVIAVAAGFYFFKKKRFKK